MLFQKKSIYNYIFLSGVIFMINHFLTDLQQDLLLNETISQIAGVDQRQHQSSKTKVDENLMIVNSLGPFQGNKHIEEPKNQSDSFSKKGTQKSANHNFQKHTVVTIRKLVKIRIAPGASFIEQVARQMWSIFLSSGVKSKKILSILFGKIDPKDNKDKKLLESCKFQQIGKYDTQTIQKAQEYLRYRAIEDLTAEAIRQSINSRKCMKMSREFFIYFMQFMGVLREGPLTKMRINDKLSKRIETRIQEIAKGVKRENNEDEI